MHRLVVTQAAKGAVERILGESAGPATVRLELKTGACSWPSFGLTFGERLEDDSGWKTGNIEWVINRKLLDKSGTITVDYAEGGPGERFSITSDYPLAATCFGCSTCCRNNLVTEKND